jgi:hypothetical protein
MRRSRSRKTPAFRTFGGTVVALTLLGLLVASILPPAATATTNTATTAATTTTTTRPKPALCAPSAVKITATTNRRAFAPGQMVKLTSTITNISKSPCSAWLGLDPGFSPGFIVFDAKKKEVWDRCWVDDHPGGCFEILYQRRLNPRGSYHAVATWDQGSARGSRPPRRVHPGTYTFWTHFQNIPGVAVVRFKIGPPSG